MDSISGDDMEVGSKIEQLVKEVRDKSMGDRQKREKEIEDRRMSAVTKIVDSATRHGIDEEIVEARIREASTVRISQTEAYAVLAEQGDLTSQIMWWDIRVGERQTLWKGYVIRKRVLRKRIDVGSHSVEVNTRPMVVEGGGWVSECFCDNGKLVTVGISTTNMKDSALESIRALQSAAAMTEDEGVKLAFWDLFSDPEHFFSDGLTPEGD